MTSDPVSKVRGGGAAPAGVSHRIRTATPADAPAIWKHVRDFAVYQKLEDRLTGSAEKLAASLATTPPRVEGLVAEVNGSIEAYALYFPMYSSFRTAQVLFLEDLFVSEAARRRGIARSMLARLARITLERGWQRMEWYTVANDARANALYRGLGAETVDGLLIYRMSGDALEAMAGRDQEAS